MTQPLVDRIRALCGLARLLEGAAQRDDAAARLCGALPHVLGVDAAALFAGEKPSRCLGSAGLALMPPAGVPASFGDGDELARLTRWAEGAGFAGTLVTPVAVKTWAEPALLVLFSVAAVDAQSATPLAELGAAVGALLDEAERAAQMRSALADKEREQDKLVRRERLRALGDMALGIAHDFNNVLNAIIGQVGVLELQCAEKPELAQVVDGLARIRNAVVGGAETVSRLQDFSRQRKDQDFTILDLSALVRDVAGAQTWQHPRLQVQSSVAASIQISGNETDLREVLHALCANAAEAMPEGGVLGLKLSADDKEAGVVVSDRGAGMSEAVRRRAFDPFFTTKGSLATGLGLSVAYGIVRRHGGRIDLDSAAGKGARVTVRLPLAARVAEPAPAPTPPDPTPSRELRVLLVEDDEDNRETMAALLGLGGYRVTAEALGKDGVRRFGEAEFDLVLTDLGLPDMSGWDVAAAIKQAAPSMPVALITGWGLNVDGSEIRRRGVDLLIKKPIDPRKLLERLARLAAHAPAPGVA